jgi:hypothetical protein
MYTNTVTIAAIIEATEAITEHVSIANGTSSITERTEEIL